MNRVLQFAANFSLAIIELVKY